MKIRTLLSRLFSFLVDSDPATPAAKPAPWIEFRFGGFDGSRAVEDENVQIEAGRMGNNGMTYRWKRGSLAAWGLADSEAEAVACAFFRSGGRWIGGKFGWISTSRTSRSWNNIRSGYRRWDPAAFFAAEARAFCIVSKDGTRRSNLIELETAK